MCSWKFCKIHRKTPVPDSTFNKVACLRPATLLKEEAMAQVFSYEFCEIFKDIFFTEHLWMTASVFSLQLY